MMEKFLEYRREYPEFYYHDYEILEEENHLHIFYDFEIPGLCSFHPEIRIPKNAIRIPYEESVFENLVFQIGLIELISYVKCTCSPRIMIEAGYVDEEQIKWLKKLYYHGLGEFLYTNQISTSMEELFDIICTEKKTSFSPFPYHGEGNLICVGGGKDSCVSLEILKNEKQNTCLMINAKTPSLESCEKAGYSSDEMILVERILDRKIVELNEQGFLNGHTPFSAIVAFISYLCAYLLGKENIILSNESSANQPTVIGTDINHQYSKSYEFESDFISYMEKNFPFDIHYFSLLRGLSEFQIAKLFSHYKKYHSVFKSCNVGSKEKDWKWCCHCSKCLFVYIILSPFLTKEEMISIFQEDLYEKEDLLELFLETLGYKETKPFECVGTIEEARYAVSLMIQKEEHLPYLLQYYKDHYPLELDGTKMEKYNEQNHLNSYYNDLVKGEVEKYVS